MRKMPLLVTTFSLAGIAVLAIGCAEPQPVGPPVYRAQVVYPAVQPEYQYAPQTPYPPQPPGFQPTYPGMPYTSAQAGEGGPVVGSPPPVTTYQQVPQQPLTTPPVTTYQPVPQQQAMAPGTTVTQAPPPAQVETIPVAPGPGYYWTPGYWSWRGGAWVWVGGAWVVRPAPGAVWVPGHWVRHGHGWLWVGGGWR